MHLHGQAEGLRLLNHYVAFQQEILFSIFALTCHGSLCFYLLLSSVSLSLVSVPFLSVYSLSFCVFIIFLSLSLSLFSLFLSFSVCLFFLFLSLSVYYLSLFAFMLFRLCLTLFVFFILVRYLILPSNHVLYLSTLVQLSLVIFSFRLPFPVI